MFNQEAPSKQGYKQEGEKIVVTDQSLEVVTDGKVQSVAMMGITELP